jgi:hypothetical protein
MDYIFWLFGRSRYGRHADNLGRLSTWLLIFSMVQLAIIVIVTMVVQHLANRLSVELFTGSLVVCFASISLSFKLRDRPLSYKALASLTETYKEIAKQHLSRETCSIVTFNTLAEEDYRRHLSMVVDREIQRQCDIHGRQKNVLS